MSLFQLCCRNFGQLVTQQQQGHRVCLLTQRGGTVRNSVPAPGTIRHGPKFRPGLPGRQRKWGGAPVNYCWGKERDLHCQLKNKRKRSEKYTSWLLIPFYLFFSAQLVICSGIISWTFLWIESTEFLLHREILHIGENPGNKSHHITS
jgi:hypothetical protein